MSLKQPTSYGTLTTTTTTTATPHTTSGTTLTFTTRATQALTPTRRPWKVLLNPRALSVPDSHTEATSRIRHNLNHFRGNYTVVFLSILFFSLLWHPVSMIIFICVFVAWMFFYFSRDYTPLLVFGYEVDDRVVIFGLGLVTVLALVMTHVGLNVLVALIVAVVVVGVHAAFRGTEDLFFDEESGADGGLVSVVGGQALRPNTMRYTRI